MLAKTQFRISQEMALKFQIISKANRDGKEFIDFKFLDIQEDEKQISVKIATGFEKKEKQKVLCFLKDKINPYQATFLGWAFIVLNRGENDYMKKAGHFLGWAISKNVESYLPYYLLADNNFFRDGVAEIDRYYADMLPDDSSYFPFDIPIYIIEFADLYKALNKTDISPLYYLLLGKLEKNIIRAQSILKEGWKKFPDDFDLALKYATRLFREENNLPGCLEVIEKYKSFNNQVYLDSDYLKFIYLEVITRNLLGDLEGAIKTIEVSGLNSDLENFFLGIILYKKDDIEAEKHFVKAIEENYKDDEITQASLYYLLGIYKRSYQENKSKIGPIIDSIKLRDNRFNIWHIDINYLKLAKKSLNDLIDTNLNDMLLKKIQGILGYVFCFELLKIHSNEGEIAIKKNRFLMMRGTDLLESALKFYPNNKDFNLAYSDLLYIDKKYDKTSEKDFKEAYPDVVYEDKRYDNAMIYALKALGDTRSSTFADNYISLEDCSDDLLENYVDILSTELNRSESAVLEYFRMRLTDDIKCLYNKKKYNLVVDLFNYLDNCWDTKLEERLKRDGYDGYFSIEAILFEVAYAFNEMDNIPKAKWAYEKYSESYVSSSALNNLALIYEKAGDIPKAIDLK